MTTGKDGLPKGEKPISPRDPLGDTFGVADEPEAGSPPSGETPAERSARMKKFLAGVGDDCGGPPVVGITGRDTKWSL